MAVEPQIPAVMSFNMANADFWSIGMKTANAEDYQETKNCLFAILGWLGQVNLENSFVASADLVSYLKFSFSKYVSRYSPCSFISYRRFPYEENTVNEWFDLAPGDDWPQRDEAVKAINLDKDGHAGKCYRAQDQVENAFPDSLEDEEFEIFFHGTRHDSAQNIIECGIDTKKGKQSQDFSDGDGFYLSKSFDEAWRWSHKYNSSAVLVFRVKKTELRGDNSENGWDLRDPANKKEWQEVVKKFRCGNTDRKFRRDINRKYQFIEGPMASLSRKNPRVSFPVQKDGSYQLCVRKDSCAELFDRGLHSAVFFDK